MKRDCSIDAYRVCLMFGICLLHSITQAGHNVAWAANMLEWCVPGFVFISGWFGIRFSIGKVLKLYGTSLYCATVFILIDAMAGDGAISIVKMYEIAKGQWFLNAYVVVMCLAPIVNLAIDRMTIRELYPVVLCVFAWSFATRLPIVGPFLPKTAGLDAYSFMMLLGVYVTARFIHRMYDASSAFRGFFSDKRYVLPIIGVSLIMAGIGLGDYNSPFALLIASGFFSLAMGFRLPHWVAQFCVWIGPSMFSVYLIHAHTACWKYLTLVLNRTLEWGCPLYIAYVVTAAAVFSVCVLCDLPRRLFASGFRLMATTR